jgi:predicted nucleotidyltransferase
MTDVLVPELPALSAVEQSCLVRYVCMLVERVEQLEEIVLFGSVARGESWPAGMRIRSDIDLLVITRDVLTEAMVNELLDATFPLFLECGRALGPQFRTREQLEAAGTTGAASFRADIERDGVCLFRRISISDRHAD